MVITGIVFLLCILLLIRDKYLPSVVLMCGCIILVALGQCTVQEAFIGFCNEITFIVLGTEIYGVALVESGTLEIFCDKLIRYADKDRKKIVFLCGFAAAVLSAFLNNQVVCSIMLVLCISLAQKCKEISVLDITLPIILCAVIGGQCTLIGAPATIVGSSIMENETGNALGMFEMLPMGIVILVVNLFFMLTFQFKIGEKAWGKRKDIIANEKNVIVVVKDKKKIKLTLAIGAVMLLLFLTQWVSVGMTSMIGGVCCILFGVVDGKEAYKKIDWNIIIWLACSIGITNTLNNSGLIQLLCEQYLKSFIENLSPFIILGIIIFLVILISNFIANTTTVMLILPIALNIAEMCGCNKEPFSIAVIMAAGMAFATPFSSGFVGMTTRIGYKFKDYVRYGIIMQLVSAVVIYSATVILYPF